MILKPWLESNSDSIQFADTVWKTPPAYPYGVFMDDCTTRGADDKLCIKEHDVTIELYSEIEGTLAAAEAAMEALFLSSSMQFEKLPRNWIEQERHFQSTYTFSYTEKF